MEQTTKRPMDWKKYVSAFVITTLIFGTAIVLGNYFNNRKINEVKNVESKISVDILASETQYTLLSESSCKDLESSTLSQELNSLDEQLNYLEQKFGANSAEFINVKKYYSVL
jgi:regulatory protein YycI of two-component signal transduction system YycFG